MNRYPTMSDKPVDLEFSQKYDRAHAERYLRKHRSGLSRKLSHWRDVQIAQRKFSKTQFYPQEAVKQGIEGDVRLILRLSTDGTVDDVSIAASSGHLILDNAAIKAAYAMGKLTGVVSRELILPVSFRLE